MNKRLKKLKKEIVGLVKKEELGYYQVIDGTKIDALELPECNKILVVGLVVKKENE